MDETFPMASMVIADRDFADAWLYAVLADPGLQPGAKCSASLLRLRWNPVTALASPSIEGWAADTCQNPRTIDKHRAVLRAAGLIRWSAPKGRVRCDYQLLITPAVWRGLKRCNPRRAAEVEAANPVTQAGVQNYQPPPVGTPTPAWEASNPRPQAGRTLKPIEPLQRTPAHRPGLELPPEIASKRDALLADLETRGAAHWLRGAVFVPGNPVKIVLSRAFEVNWARGQGGGYLDRHFGQGNWIAEEASRAA